QQLQLVVHGQAVAALALDRRDAEAQHVGEEVARALEQVVFADGAGEADGAGDAAAAGGDVGVGGAAAALGELVGPPAGERQVGVAVDQAGDDEPAAGVDALGGAELGGQVGGGAGPADAAGVPGEGGVGDQAGVVGLKAGAAGGQFADIGQDGGHTLLSLTPSSPVSPRSQAPLGNASPRSSASRLDRGNGPASGGRREA